MKKITLFLVLIITLTLCLASCDLSQILGAFGTPETPEAQPTKYKVMLSLPEGVRVIGENPVTVKAGESVKFNLEYDEGYMFYSLTAGTYDVDSHAVIINNVQKDTNPTLTVKKYDFDTQKTFRYIFYASPSDVTSISSGTMVNAGIVVNVKATDTSRRFLGWTLGATYAAGGEVISTDRECAFLMHEDLASEDGFVTIYSNYADTNTLYYDPNGGFINTNSVNFNDTTYYSATVATVGSSRLLSVKMKESYFSKVESYSSFYDDGTFYRNGYVLKEYNTEPDGTGESYSIGSKVYFPEDGETPTLYCIWAKATPESAFSYSTYTMVRPVKSAYAPDWNNKGVIINGYETNDETLVIPETIAGMPVIAIDEGAIVGKDTKTLVLNRNIQRIRNGAIQDCPSLETVYYADSIYEMYNEALDSESYTSLTKIIVNATMAPRYAKSLDGAHAIKLSRLLAGRDDACIIVIGGSSIYEGLATEYAEALFDGDFRVVNFGTTRTTHCTMYLEAMGYYAGEDDVVIYAPENSSYLLGERELYWKTMRDLEGMNNIYRYVDMSQYTNFFSAYTDFNQNYRYKRAGVRYEDIAAVTTTDENGDHTAAARQGYVDDSRYSNVYYHSLNNRTKSRHDGNYQGDAMANKEDYNNPNNETWCSIDDPYYLEPMNRIIGVARSSGAKVYFGFCPTDGDALVDAAKSREWISAYDALIAEIYDFDGSVGVCEDYIYNHLYFYDCAFHLNDYGRTYRTYQLYLDLCEILGIEAKYGIYDLGTSFDGCLFENRSSGRPLFGVDYLMEE